MEMMNELLEKYFRGETSLAEENELQYYFSTGNVSSEYEIYKALFDEFEQEKQDIAFEPLKKVLTRKRNGKNSWIKMFSYSGIAAAVMLILWVQLLPQQASYAIIHGHRIDDQEYVQQYAQKRLNYVNEMLQKGLRPMKTMEMVKQNLQPLNKIKETQDKIIEQERINNINN